jgi:hypothetical protein
MSSCSFYDLQFFELLEGPIFLFISHKYYNKNVSTVTKNSRLSYQSGRSAVVFH